MIGRIHSVNTIAQLLWMDDMLNIAEISAGMIDASPLSDSGSTSENIERHSLAMVIVEYHDVSQSNTRQPDIDTQV